MREVIGRIWIRIILGIGIGGALIHGYMPQDLIARIMGADAWLSVPASVTTGIPMKTNAPV